MTVAHLPGALSCVMLCGFLLFAVIDPRAFAQSPRSPQANQPDWAGRIIATITTLEGTVHLSGVQVELRTSSDPTVIAKTMTDGAGLVTFPDVPPGRYILKATRAGFLEKDSAPFEVRPNHVAEVLVDIQLTFVLPAIEVRAATPSPTDSVQPVSMSDMLAGSVFDLAPLEGDDFQSLMLLLPGVVRGADGRLRIKAASPRKVRCRSAAPASTIRQPATSIWICRRRAWTRLKCSPIRLPRNMDASRRASLRFAPGVGRTSGRSSRAGWCRVSGRGSKASAGSNRASRCVVR